MAADMTGGDPIQATHDDFAAQVRDALANLYDPVALSAHPLGRLLTPVGGAGRGFQGSALRETLATAIEHLKPGPEVDSGARPWRPYRVLRLRYIECLDPTEVQQRLGMSRSLYYREHEAALAALTAGLHGLGTAGQETPGFSPSTGAAEDRVDRITETSGGAAPRVRAIGGFALGMLAVLSLLFVAQKVFPHSAAEKAGGGTGATGRQAAGTSAGAVTSVTLSVFAGNGQAGHVNGAAAQAEFSGPFGLSVASNGTLYVADTGNQCIRRVGPTGLVSDVAGSGVDGYADGPAATAQFSSPNAVTVGPDGTVYVGDFGNLRIRAISPSGTVSTLAGSGVRGYVNGFGTAAQFAATGAVITDAAGNVYVPDPFNSVVRRITPAGVVSTFAGNGTRGHLDGPAGIAQFNSPMRGGGVDGAGNVYILDTADNAIRKITPAGIVSTVAGGGAPGFADGPITDAKFSSNILGIMSDAAGNLYVMDAGNRRVRAVSRDGVVSTLFEFTDPNQAPGNIKVDKDGNLYLSDREHNVIYKLTIQRGG